ncbi:MAG: hypothetical protein HYW93_06830 [Thaumarchaeota archaeon]|nr:hypothetical protein [Nitrososphaerota archaeon]
MTGAGGFAGVNFVRALRASRRKYRIVGSDFNKYHLILPDVDRRYLTPRHNDRKFISEVARIVKRERVDFVHPQPSSEALVISAGREKIDATVFLPSPNVMRRGQDKLQSQKILASAGVPVAETKAIAKDTDVAAAFRELGRQVWVRARHGAGGRLSLLCSSAEEARLWVELWVKRGTPRNEFMIQKYLPGRNVAWDSIWKDGELVTSYARERLEYPFKHISPSGITGTPSVARTVHDRRLNSIARNAVEALDSHPSGAYSIDLKESSEGVMCVTEVDAGKFHSTMPLWGFIAVSHLKLPWYSNLADLYVRLGLGEKVNEKIPQTDLLPAGYYLLRDMDVGAYLWREDGWKKKVL